MLVEFKDFIKTFNIGDYFSIGLIDSSKDKSICVYDSNINYRLEAIGKVSKYDITDMSILIHWNKNLAETETAARSLYDLLRYQKDIDLDNDIHVYYLDLTSNGPIYLGTDENGIYEYVITLKIYYRR